MKLSKSAIAYIKNAVRTAQLVKIPHLLIEPDRVVGCDEDLKVMLLHTTNVPQFEFGSIALNRLDVFLDRLDLSKGIKDTHIEAVAPDPTTTKITQPFVRSLVIKGTGFKVDYRCANPDALGKMPKSFNDVPAYTIDVNDNILSILTRGSAAMESKEVTFACDNCCLTIRLTDRNGDDMEYQLDKPVTILDGEFSPDFEFKYSLEWVLPLFRAVGTSTIDILSKGMIKIPVNDLTVYIQPMVKKR